MVDQFQTHVPPRPRRTDEVIEQVSELNHMQKAAVVRQKLMTLADEQIREIIPNVHTMLPNGTILKIITQETAAMTDEELSGYYGKV